MEFPGTRQICAECGSPTDRCEEDAIWNNDDNPICEECYQIHVNNGEMK
jgi:hypothetical protein